MIHRSEHSAQKRFAIVTRSLAQDKSLSFQARGLLLYVLSKPEGWKAKDADLMKQGGIKKHAYQSILSELKAAGYARRVENRKKGTFAYSLEVFEEPQLTESVQPVQPLPDYPHTVDPIADEPPTDSQVAVCNSTCAGAANTLLTDQREIRDIAIPSQPVGQPKPRRGELYVLPPDSMLTLDDDDLAWLKLKAPNITDPDRTTEKWFLKQQKNIGRGHTIAEWKASWQGYMMNYSDGEVSRNGRNGNNGDRSAPKLSTEERDRKQADLRERMTGARTV